MHQFTEADIGLIKGKVLYFVQAIAGGSSLLDKYVTEHIITKEQSYDIVRYIKASGFKNIDYHPLPKPLQPLIDIAHQRIKEEVKAAAAISVKRSPYYRERTFSSSSYDWGYEDDSWVSSNY